MFSLEDFQNVEIFKGLGESELGKIFTLGREKEYAAGAIIVREGASGGMLQIILEGRVEVRKHAMAGEDKPLAMLGAGTVFGEMSLFDGYPYSATIVAAQDTRTLSIFRNDFMAFAEAEPALAFKITVNLLNILSQKLRKTNENLITLALMRAQGGA